MLIKLHNYYIGGGGGGGSGERGKGYRKHTYCVETPADTTQVINFLASQKSRTGPIPSIAMILPNGTNTGAIPRVCSKGP